MKHQEDASDSEDDEEEARDPPEAERIGESKAMAFYPHRKDVEEKVVIHEHGALQIRIRYSSSENGTPHCRI